MKVMLCLLLEVAVLWARIARACLEAAWRRAVAGRRKAVTGRTVLVTGAASGLGRQLARSFARLGARVVLWDIDEAGNAETARLVRCAGGEVWAFTCDVRCRDAVHDAAETLRHALGTGVDLLVNNAGVMAGRELLELSEGEVLNTMTTNSIAHFWTVQEFLPEMMNNRYGHIINVSSMSGVHGVAMVTDYSASKFAVMGFTEALEDELHRNGFSDVIKTTVACPYMVNTNLLSSIQHRVRPRARFDRVMEAEEVAEAVVDAVLRDVRVVYVPGKTGVMPFLKTNIRANERILYSINYDQKRTMQIKIDEHEEIIAEESIETYHDICRYRILQSSRCKENTRH